MEHNHPGVGTIHVHIFTHVQCTHAYGGKVIEILQVMGITVGGRQEWRSEDGPKRWMRRKVWRKREDRGRERGRKRESGKEKGRSTKWRREKGNTRVGEAEMTEPRRQEGHMYCQCNEKIKTSAPLYIVLHWIGEMMTFSIPSCLSIPINAHSMPVIMTVQIKHRALNFSIRHYII